MPFIIQQTNVFFTQSLSCSPRGTSLLTIGGPYSAMTQQHTITAIRAVLSRGRKSKTGCSPHMGPSSSNHLEVGGPALSLISRLKGLPTVVPRPNSFLTVVVLRRKARRWPEPRQVHVGTETVLPRPLRAQARTTTVLESTDLAAH